MQGWRVIRSDPPTQLAWRNRPPGSELIFKGLVLVLTFWGRRAAPAVKEEERRKRTAPVRSAVVDGTGQGHGVDAWNA